MASTTCKLIVFLTLLNDTTAPKMPKLPWYVARASKEQSWKNELRQRGVKFAIGNGACRQRSRTACEMGVSLPECAANASMGDATGWAGWSVPEELRARGTSSGDAALYVPLLQKLRRGQPITLLALGSSVVGAHAGCTAPWPLLKHCPCPKCCGSRCGRWGGDGWALRVLAQINATWPNPEHKLYNLGEPGGDLMPSLLTCPASYLTFQPDLVILDFFTAYHGGRDAVIYERVVRMLLEGDAATAASAPPAAPAASAAPATGHVRVRPVVMFVGFFEFGDRHHAKSTFTTLGSQLAAALGRDASAVVDLWHAHEPARVEEMSRVIRAWARTNERDISSTDVWRNWWRDQEVRALQLAYRLPAVWMFHAFGAEFETHRHGLWARDFACFDGLHPNHDGRAERMVSDLVWKALKEGLDGAAPLPADARYVLPPSLQTLPNRVGYLCFQFDAEGWEMLTGAKRTNRKLHEQSLIQTREMPTIVRNEGWQFVMYEPNSRTPFKPGIVAHAPGARLHFKLDTSRVREPSVALQYLESHTGMGTATVDCKGCECSTTTIDASGKVARLSTLSTREIAVSADPQCELHITLRNDTAQGSGAAKFKLVRLFVLGASSTATSAHFVAADPALMPDDEPIACRRPRGGRSCSVGRGRRARLTSAHGAVVTEHGGTSSSGQAAELVMSARNVGLELLRAARTARKNSAGLESLELLL